MDNILTAFSSDVGNVKSINEDSLLIKTAEYEDIQIGLLCICDGVGGLSRGEYASKYVVEKFSKWFDNSLPKILGARNWKKIIREQCVLILENANNELAAYGRRNGARTGTTCSTLLIVGKEYFLIHIGDTRVYEISDELVQITNDHTLLARDVAMGRVDPSVKENGKGGNVLFQCIGVSEDIDPQYFEGEVNVNATYMLCSDGFRHKIEPHELVQGFNVSVLTDEIQMEKQCKKYVELNKLRQEKDNISVIIARYEEE